MPTYVAFEGVEPDLPANEDGVSPGFFEFPKDAPSVTDGPPGDGRALNALTQTFGVVAPGPEGNDHWQTINKRVGADITMTITPAGDYEAKFATMVAANQIPDLVQLNQSMLDPSLLAAQFTDLSEFLGGDKVKDYPFLANIGPDSWTAAMLNGRIYGIPIPRNIVGEYKFERRDIFDNLGLPTEMKSFDEFVEVSKQFTDPKNSRWMLGTMKALRTILRSINGEPNSWTLDGGKLVRDFETPEFEQTVADMTELWAKGEGIIHPDGFTPTQPTKDLFTSGRIGITVDGYAGYQGFLTSGATVDGFAMDLWRPWLRDGSAPAPWPSGNGAGTVTGIRKQESDDDVVMILKILNWLAAPFGTEEYNARKYGRIGIESEFDEDGIPQRTEEGSQTLTVPFGYLADAPVALFHPGHVDDTKLEHAFQTEALAEKVLNPTLGLYSATDGKSGTLLETNFYDEVYEIVQGRKEPSALAQAIDTWRSGGGDQMRGEYEDQLS